MLLTQQAWLSIFVSACQVFGANVSQISPKLEYFQNIQFCILGIIVFIFSVSNNYKSSKYYSHSTFNLLQLIQSFLLLPLLLSSGFTVITVFSYYSLLSYAWCRVQYEKYFSNSFCFCYISRAEGEWNIRNEKNEENIFILHSAPCDNSSLADK